MTPTETLWAALAALVVVAVTRLIDMLLPKDRHLKWIDDITVPEPEPDEPVKPKRKKAIDGNGQQD